MRSTGSAVTETEAAHYELIGQSAADCSLTGVERSLIKLNQCSYPNVRIVITSICKTLLALINISCSSWLGIRYNILPSYDLVARNAE
jgi:hypothetical protein